MMKVFPLGKEDFWKPKLYWEEVHCWEAERLFICHNGMKPRWEWHGRNPSDCIPSLGETFTLPFLFHSSLSFQYYSWEKQPGLHSPNNKRHHHDLISCLSPSPMNYLPYSQEILVTHWETHICCPRLRFGNVKNNLKLFVYGGLFDL